MQMRPRPLRRAGLFFELAHDSDRYFQSRRHSPWTLVIPGPHTLAPNPVEARRLSVDTCFLQGWSPLKQASKAASAALAPFPGCIADLYSQTRRQRTANAVFLERPG